MPIYRRGETWWITITHNGQRIRRTAGTADRAEAQRMHDEIKAGLWQQQRSGATLNDALKLWLKSAPRSVNERNAIKLFIGLYHNRPLAEITGPSIAAALADKGPAHANRITNIIRAALNLAVEHGLIDSAPSIARRKAPAGRLRWLTRAEFAKLRLKLPEHLRHAADFAVATGLRQANVLGLRWEQIDLKRRMAWVDAADMKTRRAHGIPLSDAAIAALRAVLGQHPDYVFTYLAKKARDGEPEIRRPIGSPKTAWAKAIESSGIKPATWHDLRHTWASWHVQAGTPLAVLKTLGGWSSMDMVMRYAHLAPEHLGAWASNAETGVTEIVTARAGM